MFGHELNRQFARQGKVRMSDTIEMVTIPAARLAELEAAVETLRSKLAKRNHVNMDRLITYQKENPEKVLEKKRDYLARNRAEINARRRDAYRKKKEEAAALSAAGIYT